MRLHKFALLAGVALLTACPPINQAEAQVQDAINEILQNSASWQTTLQNLETQLVSDGQQLLANQVTQLLENGVAVAGAEVRCDVDFIATQTKNGLLQILSSLDPQIPPPIIVPALCQVVPSTIDMNDPPNVVNFYGYNFDATNGGFGLTFDHDGVSDDVSRYVTVVTPYLLTIDVSQTGGLPICDHHGRSLVLGWGGTVLSTVNVVDKTCPQGSWKPGPPQTTLPGYPHDFTLGGGLFGARSDFTAGNPCTPGYVRVDPPEVSDMTGGNSGDCGIAWASPDDTTDCAVKVHMGVNAFNGLDCQVTIYEVGQAVWVPPPPCTCQ
jgi:hypothetical protein